ncbi:MAG: GDP-L-fucose synthase [Thermodesulfovibrionia bacterium]|nr:GDP-L-fucose synthase [Thermodesulfovibrionia bacterium]
MKIDSKIYVAGHKGLVGSFLVRKLQHKKYNDLITKTHSELDLTRQADVELFFERTKPEYVFLAAAKVGGILANNTYKAEFIYNNIAIATNIIHTSYKYGVKKLLNLGSSCIYPKFTSQPMKEENILTGSLEPTNEPYAIAKIAAIKLCRYYNEQYGTNYISVMPTNIYGPNDNFNLETAHVIPALIRKFHLAKLMRNQDFNGIKNDFQCHPLGFELERNIIPERNETLVNTLDRLGISAEHVTLWGAGKPYREFLYVDDLADASVYLMENYDYEAIGEFINVGTGEDIKIKDLAELIKEIVSYEGEIKYDLSKPEGTPRKLLDVSKIESLGWKPNIGLRSGIQTTYNWYVRETSFPQS